MIKAVIAKGDIEYLTELYETYAKLDDEKELLKVCNKLIQKAFQIEEFEKLEKIFDTIYRVISKQRTIYRNLVDIQLSTKKTGKIK